MYKVNNKYTATNCVFQKINYGEFLVGKHKASKG